MIFEIYAKPKFEMFKKVFSYTGLRNWFLPSRTLRTQSEHASSIDQEEIKKFSKFNENEWYGSEFEPLRAMNKLRVPLIRDALANQRIETIKPLSGFKILDVGCGAGLLTEPLARLGAEVTGIDPLDNNIEIAMRHFNLLENFDNTINYHCTTVEDYSKDNVGVFDAVVASEVLEHVSDVELVVDNCLKCLKNNGKLFITTINQTPIAYLTAILGAENLLGLIPKGTHQYEKFIMPSALQMLLEDCKY